MQITLHTSVKKGKHSTIVRGWEFPDVIVEGKTYEEAVAIFKEAVIESMQADYLESLEKLKTLTVGKKSVDVNEIPLKSLVLPVLAQLQNTNNFKKIFLATIGEYLKSSIKNQLAPPPKDMREVIMH